MRSRRGVSAIVAGLIAVVAVLGTTVYFMSGNSIIQMPVQEGQQKQSQSLSEETQLQLPSTTVTQQQTTESGSESSYSDDTDTPLTMEEECAQLGISQENCNENNILAKKRLMASQPIASGQESIKVIKASSWVAGNDDATTAFVLQNTGSNVVTVSSITLRGISVPTSDWFYTISSDSAVLQTELKVDHTEDNVVLGGQATAMNTGLFSLAPGQAAIVYLDEAGKIDAIDAGNTYALQIQAGQATAVQQVSVVTG